MLLYLFIFIVIVMLFYVSHDRQTQEKYFMLCMIFLALFVGLADMLGGYDRYIYGALFDGAADVLHSGGNIFQTELFLLFGKEFGYCAWNYLIAIFTSNRYIFICISTLVMYFFFYKALSRQCDNTMLALVLFMALTFYFSFTYLRQMMAAAIAWQSLQYIEKRNFLKFTLWVVLAFSFHNSAIVFFPIYFLPLIKYQKRTVIIVALLSLALGVSGLSSALFEAYANVDSVRAERAGYAVEEGFRWAYFLEAVFFLLLIIWRYDQICNDPKTLIGLNLAVVFCCILLIFIKSENGGRLGWYYIIGLFSLFSSLCDLNKRVIKPALIVVVSFMLFFRITHQWGENGFQILYPYKTFLTDGVRQPDRCHDVYEYDFNYDINKFYR